MGSDLEIMIKKPSVSSTVKIKTSQYSDYLIFTVLGTKGYTESF